MRKMADLTGNKYGRLTVQGLSGKKGKHNRTYWACVCDCGNKVNVSHDRLTTGQTKSCGCLKVEMATSRIIHYNQEHNQKGENRKFPKCRIRIRQIYRHILDRCYKEDDPQYKNYGARGIAVCEEWKNNFENFYKWSLCTGYKDSLTIDRIDVNGNYCPENCRWASMEAQANNKTNNVRIAYKEKQYTIAEFSKIIGIKTATMWNRYKSGWSVEEMSNPMLYPRRGRRKSIESNVR